MRRVFVTYLGNSLLVPDGETVIGRDLSCQIRFNDPSVSRRHLLIRVAGDQVQVEDLGGRNGTLCNGVALQGTQAAGHGTELLVGSRRIQISILDEHQAADDPTYGGNNAPAVDVLAPELSRREQSCPKCNRQVKDDDEACAGCGYNWAAFRPRAITKRMNRLDPAEVGAERRRHARHRVDIPILYHSDHLALESMAIDLSRSGVFVKTQILDEVGTACMILVMVDGGPALPLRGRVTRVVVDESASQPQGLGVEFDELTPAARAWLDDLLPRIPAPTAPPRG